MTNFLSQLSKPAESTKELVKNEFDVDSLTESQQKVYDKVIALPEIVVLEYPHPQTGEPSGTFGCFRNDTWGKVGGTVTKNWQAPTRSQLVQLAMAATQAFDGSEVEVQATIFQNGYSCTVKPTAEYRQEVIKGDDLWPMLTARMNFGGTGTDNISLGMCRDMCRNMAMIQSVESYNRRLRHSRDHGVFMQQAIEDCSELAGGFDSMVEKLREIAARKIDFNQLIGGIFEQRIANAQKSGRVDEAGNPKLPNQTIRALEAIQTRYNNEAKILGLDTIGATNTEMNAWVAYNAVQGYYQHDANRRAAGNDYEQALVAAGKQEVQIAENMVLELAA